MNKVEVLKEAVSNLEDAINNGSKVENAIAAVHIAFQEIKQEYKIPY